MRCTNHLNMLNMLVCILSIFNWAFLPIPRPKKSKKKRHTLNDGSLQDDETNYPSLKSRAKEDEEKMNKVRMRRTVSVREAVSDETEI